MITNKISMEVLLHNLLSIKEFIWVSLILSIIIHIIIA